MFIKERVENTLTKLQNDLLNYTNAKSIFLVEEISLFWN